jgi:hypothetical protein
MEKVPVSAGLESPVNGGVLYQHLWRLVSMTGGLALYSKSPKQTWLKLRLNFGKSRALPVSAVPGTLPLLLFFPHSSGSLSVDLGPQEAQEFKTAYLKLVFCPACQHITRYSRLVGCPVYPGPRVHLCKEKSSGGTVGLSGNEYTSGTPICRIQLP